MDKNKYNIIFKNFAQPIANLKMDYSSSALTVDNGVVDRKVEKAFANLLLALTEQLDKYRK